MENREQIIERIMAEIEKEVTKFLEKVEKEKPGGAELEKQARRIGQRCGAAVLEEAIGEYGNGNQGKKLGCKCRPGYGQMKFVRHDRVRFTSSTGEIEVKSAYYHCRICKSSRWPLYEELGLGPGELTEVARRMVAQAGAIIGGGGFERAAEVLEEFSGIWVSESTMQKVTEQVGQQIRAEQKEEVERAWERKAVVRRAEAVKAERKKGKILHIAVDGTTVCTDNGTWREVKNGVIYETRCKEGKKGQEVRAVKASYVSTFDKAEAFGKELWVEAARREAPECDKVVVLGDGSVWIWNLYAEHFPDNREELLDYYHASEHLAEVAKAQWGENTKPMRDWHRKQNKRLLKKNGAIKVVQQIRKLRAKSEAARKVKQETLRYLENNLKRMNYYEARGKGYHIGSGLAESACKHLVGARLKQAGMTNWKEQGAEAVLRVRTVIENDKFDHYCDKILTRRYEKAA